MNGLLFDPKFDDADRYEFLYDANSLLLSLIPKDQQEEIFSQYLCDIDEECLGTIDIYLYLCRFIPFSWKIVDLGCSFAPQCFFFQKHAQYIGVDIFPGKRFFAENTTHLTLSIEDFLKSKEYFSLELGKTFAITAYVPIIDDDLCRSIREAFPNSLSYSPISSTSKTESPVPSTDPSSYFTVSELNLLRSTFENRPEFSIHDINLIARDEKYSRILLRFLETIQKEPGQRDKIYAICSSLIKRMKAKQPRTF